MGEKKVSANPNEDASSRSTQETNKDWVPYGKSMPNRISEETRGRFHLMEEKWKLLYDENYRSPTYSVSHYISYLKRYVTATSQLRVAVSGKTTERFAKKEDAALYDKSGKRVAPGDTQRSLDSISPMSYFIRKLKLDLKMAFIGFVEEFIQPPNHGLRLLVSLLRNLQVLSTSPADRLFSRVGATGTLKMDEYKKNMIDEQDCLLCIKYTLRSQRAMHELLEHNPGLLTVTDCVLSNFSRSRISALEILTLLLTGPESVDRVLDAFTSLRIKQAESCRFKMLINMLYTRGVSHVLFQVSCLRMLNTLVNLCKSANMRVYLQYEIEEAGLDLLRIERGAVGDGLEYDDLRKEISDWKMRYIDVDALLRKIKADIRVDTPGEAAKEFQYDQHFGPRQDEIKELGILSGRIGDADHGQWDETVKSAEGRAARELSLSARYPSISTRPSSHQHMDSHHNTENVSASFNKNATINDAVDDRSGDANQGDAILSHTPSPSNPRPTNALNTGSVGRDFATGGFSAITTELWEPCGLVIKPDTPVVPLPQESSSGNTDSRNVRSQNWLFSPGTSRSSSDNEHKNFMGNAYRNGPYVFNHMSQRLNEENITANKDTYSESAENDRDSTAFISKTTSKLFYTPKDSGLESGPLRWFNPGITLPPSPTNTRKTSADIDTTPMLTNRASSYNYARNTESSPIHPKLPTPPPDYDVEPDNVLDTHYLHRLSPATTTVSHTSTFIQGTDAPPAYTSSVDANFQRWPPVRRKSFSDLTKEKPTPAVAPALPPRAPVEPTSSFSSFNSAKSPGLPFDNKFNVNPPHSQLAHGKSHATRYIKHGEVRHPSPDYSPPSVRRSPDYNTIDNDATATTLPRTYRGANKRNKNENLYSPSQHSSRASRPTTPDRLIHNQAVRARPTRSLSPEHHRIKSVVDARDGSAKSTIFIATNNNNLMPRNQNSDAMTSNSNGKATQNQTQITTIVVHGKTTGADGATRSTVDKQKETPRVISNNSGSHVHSIGTNQNSIDEVISNMIRSRRQSPVHLVVNPILPNNLDPTKALSQPRSKSPTINQMNHGIETTSPTYPHILARSDKPSTVTARESSYGSGSKKTLAPSTRRQDSDVSYSDELGRVLGELDQALESQAGWQTPSLQQSNGMQQKAPMVAYV